MPLAETQGNGAMEAKDRACAVQNGAAGARICAPRHWVRRKSGGAVFGAQGQCRGERARVDPAIDVDGVFQKPVYP